MCLAVPGRIIACDGDEALADLQGNRLKISRVLTPEAGAGDWVLIHAGFAIATIDERDAVETWSYLRAAYGGELPEVEGDAGIERRETG